MSSHPLGLTVSHLIFGFSQRLLLADWSAHFGPGLTWVQGPNGCGKSTLLRLMGGAIAPQGGTLSINGCHASQDPLAYRQQVLWLGPDRIAFDHLKPLEWAGFMAGLYPRFDRAAFEQHWDAFALAPHQHQRIAALSTGTQRKLALAVAWAAQTPALLLDEPLSGLDAAALAHAQAVLAVRAQSTEMVTVIASHEALQATDVRVLGL
ncbi:ABC transporter ATP-binding protein [Ideonella paludis]|uniref:ATP-binding cassette domain-containing protein n=1 Tax=Ideonella paludis TaxID=1233411 RepID=A0ABS5DX17_9BURK|nr:ATP-binding cassette domain-containing protein [Ideonella paludis]MBQ0935696.1 ATP-binding cassette domain-containing protein [Ideonella paludis]